MTLETPIVYLIPGLGVDERIFQFLNLKANKVKCIKWLNPAAPAESLKLYCQRLLEQIDQEKEIILIGVSFGGIVAQEISRLLPCKKIIIISSIKTTKEFPIEIHLVRFTKIHRIFPPRVLKWLNRFTANYYFGANSAEERQLLQEIIKDTDEDFLKWAIECIMKWRNMNVLPGIIHIHGTKDRIFSAAYIKDAQFIDGGHFMIVNESDEVSKCINIHLQ